MKTKIIYLTTLVLLISAACGCGKERVDTVKNPEQAILGRWEIIETGTGSDMWAYSSNGYIEYLQDSSVRYYSYDESRFTSETTYWLIDSILYEGTYVDGIFYGSQRKYHFFDNNDKLRLEYHETPAMVPVAVYKRIK